MKWALSWRCDPGARVIADRHYNRQSVGADNFVPPGRCLVLRCEGAFWVTSWPLAEYVRHDWAGAWVCSAFRSERPDLHTASDLIRQAVAATRWRWPEVPALGMVTFVDEQKVRPTMVRGAPVYGWTFRKAGFVEVGRTKEAGLLALQLRPDAMPAAEPFLGATLELFDRPAPPPGPAPDDKE